MTVYAQIVDGEWYRPRKKGHKVQCCDCGLVHREDYRVVDDGNGRQGVEIRSKQDARATAAVRKKFRFTKNEK